MLIKKSTLIALAIIAFVAIFIWNAFSGISQLGAGLFLFVLVGDIIFFGLIERLLYPMITKIINIFCGKKP